MSIVYGILQSHEISSNTVYCELFEVEKFRSFCRLIGDRKTFPAKPFRSSFKLEYHGRTLQEENRTVNTIYRWLFRTPLPFKISRVHAVGTPRISIAVAISGYTV